MMLRVINSGSNANGYALVGDKETLLLEAGCKPKDMKEAVDFNVSSIVGCIVSHTHLD